MNYPVSLRSLSGGLFFLAVLMVVVLARPAPARAAAKWTEVVVAEGAYDQMDDRFMRVGATDDVNVVVLHNDGSKLRAYQVMKDTVSGHTPGACCPTVTTGSQGCCAVKDIPLADIGVSNARIDLAMIEKFWKYVQAKAAADHYILDLRGMPSGSGASGIFEAGFTVADLAAAVGRFVAAQGGRKVDIFGLTFCLAGSVDWSYAFANHVDYFVGPPNWTNSPVTARWRVQRWAEELIKNPAITARDMAAKICDIFAEVGGNECDSGCTNLASGEPWTCGVSDLSQGRSFAWAMRDFACAYLDKFSQTRDKPIWDAAKLKTVPYGGTDRPNINIEHFDIKHFAMNLKSAVTDTAVKDSLTKVIAAQEMYTFKHVLEPQGFASLGGNSFGLSAYFNTLNGAVYSTPEKMGTWMTDSLWKLVLAKVENVSVVTTVASLIVDGPANEVAVGATIDLTARGANTSFPAGLCASSSVTWQVDNSAVASLASTSANPVQLKGLSAGTVKVTATAGGKSGSIDIAVTGSGSGTGGAAGASGSSGAGGAISSGGAVSKGGSSGAGGATSSGGAVSKGGSSGAGGATSSGGGTSRGGSSGAGGKIASGGAMSSGGSTTSSGGNPGKGGASGKGGTHSTGGAGASSAVPATGGSSSATTHTPTPASKGCGCRVGDASRASGSALILMGLALAISGFRRHSRRRIR